MNEKELELLLSSKMKSCVAGRRLPDDFAEKMVARIRRSRRAALRVRVVAASLAVIAVCLTIMGFMVEVPEDKPGEAALVAAHEGRVKEKVSGWMLIGFFKECFKRGRTNKRKEEY